MSEMGRLYETALDRKAEEEIAAVVIRHWDLVNVLKLSMSYQIDFACVGLGGDVVAFAEIKDRALPFGVGHGYYLGLNKAMKARQIIAATGMPVRLVVRFNDGKIWWCSATDYTSGRLVRFGRGKQRDRFDVEPCVVYPWSAFQELPQ